MVLIMTKRMTPVLALILVPTVFGLMIDVGLFDPLVRFILKTLGNDPAKVVLGTAILAAAVSLDGDGSTTFIVTTAALLPVYLRLGISPVVLTCVAGLAHGTLNIVPWGGPTTDHPNANHYLGSHQRRRRHGCHERGNSASALAKCMNRGCQRSR